MGVRPLQRWYQVVFEYEIARKKDSNIEKKTLHTIQPASTQSAKKDVNLNEPAPRLRNDAELPSKTETPADKFSGVSEALLQHDKDLGNSIHPPTDENDNMADWRSDDS